MLEEEDGGDLPRGQIPPPVHLEPDLLLFCGESRGSLGKTFTSLAAQGIWPAKRNQDVFVHGAI